MTFDIDGEVRDLIASGVLSTYDGLQLSFFERKKAIRCALLRAYERGICDANCTPAGTVAGGSEAGGREASIGTASGSGDPRTRTSDLGIDDFVNSDDDDGET